MEAAQKNNPYASALDCGACGGNHGGPSAKILAKILNEPSIRESLQKERVFIPKETVFIAAEHNTTTDEILFFVDELKKPQKQVLKELKTDCSYAASLNSEKTLP